MSASTNLVNTLQSAQKYLYQLAGPMLVLMGIVGCILNLIVFTQKALRKNPCSMYFIAYNLANLLHILASVLYLTMSLGYSIGSNSQDLLFCRIRLYITIVSNVLSPFYLILASTDRILVTSSNARVRQKSTRRLALICIVLGTVFWLFSHSHALVLTTILRLGPTTFLCYFQLGVYLSTISYYSLCKETISLLFMIICGCWALKNIRRLFRGRIAPNHLSTTGSTMGGANSTAKSTKDRQLSFILLMDISTHILFSFAFAIYLVYVQITQNDVKSAEQVQIEMIVRNLCLFSSGIPFCVSCYVNLIASKTFRKEVIKAFSPQRFFGNH